MTSVSYQDTVEADYSHVLELDLGTIVPSVAGCFLLACDPSSSDLFVMLAH